MTKCNTLNVKLSNSQLNKLKSGIENGTKITSNPSLNFVAESNDKTNFPHKLLSINAPVLRICKVFANGSSASMKFSIVQDNTIRRRNSC